MRVLYGERRRVLVNSIDKELGSMLTMLGDEAGMHLTVMLSNQNCDTEIAERAAQNLRILPLSPCYLGEARQGFILGFGSTSVEEIPAAVGKLGKLLIVK